MKTSTIALITTGVLTTATLGYLIYFDSKRRSNPEFRKQLSKNNVIWFIKQ
jgi:import receptor subunit TOM20